MQTLIMPPAFNQPFQTAWVGRLLTGECLISMSAFSSLRWSPFKLSRVEAEELLSEAEPGAYVFSHDIASELFLSIRYA